MPDTTESKTMEAGREMDALIAERICGWTITTPVDPTCHHAVGTNRDGSSARRNFGRRWNGEEDVIPQYSTDMTTAWTIFDHIGGTINLHTVEGGWACRIGPRASYWAPTAPLAICITALVAVEGR